MTKQRAAEIISMLYESLADIIDFADVDDETKQKAQDALLAAEELVP